MGNFICVAKGLSISKLSPQAKPSPQINRTVPTNLQAAPAKEVGEAGKKTPIFPAGKVAIWIAKQSVARQIYGCFVMVLFPAKTAELKCY